MKVTIKESRPRHAKPDPLINLRVILRAIENVLYLLLVVHLPIRVYVEQMVQRGIAALYISYANPTGLRGIISIKRKRTINKRYGPIRREVLFLSEERIFFRLVLTMHNGSSIEFLQVQSHVKAIVKVAEFQLLLDVMLGYEQFARVAITYEVIR